MSDLTTPPSHASNSNSTKKTDKSSARTRLWKSRRSALTFGEDLAVEIFLEVIEGEITEWTDESKMDLLADKAVTAAEAFIHALETKREQHERSDGNDAN
jgi:hypothetical protein